MSLPAGFLRALLTPCLLGAALLGACSGAGPYLWVHELPSQPAQQDTSYLIRAGDVLDIRVRQDDRLTTRARVRTDGRITIAMIGEVQAEGRTPAVLAQELTRSLEPYIAQPGVSVSVEEARPLTVTVLGELARPGVYALEPSSGVLEALASAGGLTEFAKRDSIYVLRQNPRLRVRFTYDALLWNEPTAAAFRLAPGDVVTVE
jgi:polysaccharide biosynthesis/export protein